MYAFDAYMRTSTTGAKHTKIDPTKTVFRVRARRANFIVPNRVRRIYKRERQFYILKKKVVTASFLVGLPYSARALPAVDCRASWLLLGIFLKALSRFRDGSACIPGSRGLRSLWSTCHPGRACSSFYRRGRVTPIH